VAEFGGVRQDGDLVARGHEPLSRGAGRAVRETKSPAASVSLDDLRAIRLLLGKVRAANLKELNDLVK
jgi:hypothetical protein